MNTVYGVTKFLKFAVIGNRDITLEDELKVKWFIIESLMLAQLVGKDVVFTTGGALGVDSVCIKTAQFLHKPCYVYLPAPGFYKESLQGVQVSATPSETAIIEAQKLFPKDKDFVLNLTARNLEIINGKSLDAPCDTVLYLCKKELRSGTGKAVRYANSLGIPCVNMLSEAPTKIDFSRKRVV